MVNKRMLSADLINFVNVGLRGVSSGLDEPLPASALVKPVQVLNVTPRVNL